MAIYNYLGGGIILKLLSFDDNFLNTLSDKNKKHVGLVKHLILVAVFACFLHYWVARAAIVLTVLVSFCVPGVNKVMFARKSNLIILLFCIIGWAVSFFYDNIYGIASYPMFFAIVYFSFIVRAVVTKEYFEKILNVMCVGGCTATLIAAIFESRNVRAQAGFPNPNFLGAALMIVVMACIYKVVNEAPKMQIYFIAAAVSAFGIILCGSMSIWVILAIGAAVLFLVNKNNNMLLALVCMVVVVIMALLLKPELFSRLDEVVITTQNRVNIWSFALENIKTAPIFGRGFFSYRHLLELFLPIRPDIQRAALAHNIYLDSLLCHGVVGTGLLVTYLVFYFKDLSKCRRRLKANKRNRTLNSFIIAVCVAIAAYGFIDTTFVWVQSGTLLLVIASGLGVDEKRVKNIEKTSAHQ